MEERIVTTVGFPPELHKRLINAAARYAETHSRRVTLGEVSIRAMERGIDQVEAEANDHPYIGPVYVGKYPTKPQIAALLRQVAANGINSIISPSNPPTT